MKKLKLFLFFILLLFLQISYAQPGECFHVYGQVTGGLGSPSHLEMHTRGQWLTVGTFPPMWFARANAMENSPCPTLLGATAAMDALRMSDKFPTSICYPWSLWESRQGTTITKIAVPFGDVPSFPFTFVGGCGCCENCMWKVDPTGTLAAMDCRSFVLGSNGMRVIINEHGDFFSFGPAFNFPIPGTNRTRTIPSFRMDPILRNARVENSNASGVWISDAGDGVAEIIESFPFVTIKYSLTDGTVIMLKGRKEGNSINFNIWDNVNKNVYGNGNLQLSEDGLKLVGWWRLNDGNYGNNWILRRQLPKQLTSPDQPDPPQPPEEGNRTSCDKECDRKCKQQGRTGGRFTGVCLLIPDASGKCECW